MKLKKFIKKNYKSQVEFARANSVSPQQVTQWLNKDYRVINNRLYSYRRHLKEVIL